MGRMSDPVAAGHAHPGIEECSRGVLKLLQEASAHAGSPSKYSGFLAPGSQLPLSWASAFALMQTREPLLLKGRGAWGRGCDAAEER